MLCRMRQSGTVSIIDVEGIVDINSAEIIEAVGSLISAGKKQVLINLESVKSVDYGGLSIFAIAYKNVVNNGGSMKFAHVSFGTKELFKVVGLDAIFEAYANESDAIASFNHRSPEAGTPLRRRFRRADTHLGLTYRLKGDMTTPAVFSGSVLNISGSGVFVYAPHTFPLSSDLMLDFTLPCDQPSFNVEGTVVWLADNELQPHSYPGMGIAFHRLTSAAERSIADYVDRNITNRASNDGC